MTERSSSMPRGLRALLWIARIAATLIVLFMALMLIGYAVNPQGNPATPDEAVLLALFPIGMCLGYVVAWRWPFIGGISSLVCIAAFLIVQREADMAVIVSILGTPGILFVLYGLLRRRFRAGAVSN